MNKIWLIARREFLVNVRRPAFLFGTFGVPILLTVVMVVIAAVAINSETDTSQLGRIGFVDPVGALAENLDRPALFDAYASVAEADAALASGAIGAYFALADDYYQSGRVTVIGSSNIPEGLLEEFDAFLLANLGASIAPDIVERLQDPITMQVTTLNNGRTITENGIIGLFIAPFVFVLVFMIGSQTTSSYLMSGIVEEKSNRIMEILVTSVTPFQLLFGKILGLGLLGLVLLTVWIIGGLIAMAIGGSSEILAGVSFPPDLFIIGLIYFVLTYFFLASLMAGIGAIFGSEQESRQYAGILTLPLAIPFFFIIEFFTRPDGPLVVALSLIPFTAPVAVVMRLGFGSVPVWQLALSIGLLMLTTLLLVWASARIFRYSLLMYGKRPTPRELWRVLRSGSGMNTTATAEAKG